MSSPLFTPVRIGSVELRNRVAMLPMGTRFMIDGLINDRDNAWHARRAEGGVGLIITGGTLVSESSLLRERINVEAWRPENLGPMTAKAEAVHAHGAKIVGQILHLGRETSGGQIERPQVAPSAVRARNQAYTPHELSRREITGITDSFVRCAEQFAAAGYDGTEIHAAHGYLVAQFLSPLANHRTDEFGTGLEGRARVLIQLVDRVRAACGRDFVIGVRLSASEEVDGGLELDDTVEIARLLEATGQVDYLSLTVGLRGAYVKDGATAPGFTLPIGAAVRAACTIPVILASRIMRPEVAAEAISSGSADVVGLARALIADPDWVKKAAAEQAERIRRCMVFVQDCRTAVSGVACAVNPIAGRELDERRPVVTSRPQRVVVVGGGPAGLEAARLAAEVGHQVTLYERADHLGGQLVRAARGPHRTELLSFVDYAAGELRRLGVEVRLDTVADRSSVAADQPELVVIAQGPCHNLPAFAGTTDRVFSVWDVLGPEPPAGAGSVVVADDGVGFWPTCSAAELLASRGWTVHFTSPAPQLARAIPEESMLPLLRRLRDGGVEFHPFTEVIGRAADGIQVRDVLTDAKSVLAATAVVLSPELTPNIDLAQALEGTGPRVVAIGDCLAPRRLTHAIRDAHMVVDALEAGSLPAQLAVEVV